MYQARLHPEQYSNTFSDDQIKRLHDAIMYVCDTAIEANADSDLFPEDWLMKHRWGKGKKDSNTLPNGDKITFLTVGGRTSAIVPNRQKKTAAVAGDISEDAKDDGSEEMEAKPKKATKRKAKTAKEEDEDVAEAASTVKPKRGRKQSTEEVKADPGEKADEAPAVKRRKATKAETEKQVKQTQKKEVEVKSEDTGGRRRSGRLSK